VIGERRRRQAQAGELAAAGAVFYFVEEGMHRIVSGAADLLAVGEIIRAGRTIGVLEAGEGPRREGHSAVFRA
jgi:hypothetical protein